MKGDDLAFIADEAPEAPEPTKRVRVLHPFQVVHEGIVYRPQAVAVVPRSVAAQWITNNWVTDEAGD
jgi:hypothetical protein